MSMLDPQRTYGSGPIFPKSGRNPVPVSPPHRTEKKDNLLNSENPSPDKKSDELKWMAAAQVIGAARAQMMQQHQVGFRDPGSLLHNKNDPAKFCHNLSRDPV